MDKQLFKEVLGEVPPSTVDVEAVIARGRRAERVRRVANPAVAAGLAVVLTTGAIAYALTRGDGDGLRVGGPPASSSTSPATQGSMSPSTTPKGRAGAPPAACARPDLETAPQVIARLTPLVKGSFQEQRPGVRLAVNPVSQDPTSEAHGPLEFFQVAGYSPEDVPICEFDSYFIATATVKAPEGDGSLLVSVRARWGDDLSPPDTCEEAPSGGPTAHCDEVTGPNGEAVVRKTSNEQNGVVLHDVTVHLEDGTFIRLQSSNVATDIKTGDLPTSEVPPLSHDQLTAIGTTAGFTLFPPSGGGR